MIKNILIGIALGVLAILSLPWSVLGFMTWGSGNSGHTAGLCAGFLAIGIWGIGIIQIIVIGLGAAAFGTYFLIH